MPKLFEASVETMYLGEQVNSEIKPTVFYFSLSAKESLTLDPFNSLPKLLDEKKFRTFSMTLPFHEEKEVFVDPMPIWVEKITQKDPFLVDFLEKAAATIQKMHNDQIIDLKRTCLSGLSRGAFIALQLLKRLAIQKAVLFAPFFNFEDISNMKNDAFKPFNLLNEIDMFLDKQIQTFIGNVDTMVNTDSSYQFTKKCASNAKKDSLHELFIRKSIGHKGHGTPKEAFKQGAKWIENNL